MKKLLLFLPVVLYGQATHFTPVCPTAPPVANVPFNLSINSTGQTQAASQFTLSLPASAFNVTIAAGSIAIATQKQISTLNGIVTVWGMNQTLMSQGPMVIVTMTIATPGQYQLGITSTFGTDGDGNNISTVPDPSCAVSVLLSVSKCDADGNGATNQADAVLVDSWVHKNPTVPVAQCDKNSDNACTVADVQMIVKAAVTGVCSAI